MLKAVLSFIDLLGASNAGVSEHYDTQARTVGEAEEQETCAKKGPIDVEAVLWGLPGPRKESLEVQGACSLPLPRTLLTQLNVSGPSLACC